MFPGAGQEQNRAFNRPYCAVHLLLGMASRSLRSRDGRKTGNLRWYLVYPGLVFTGNIPGQEEFSSQIVADAHSAALTLQAAAIKAQNSSERAKEESTRVQRRVSGSARRRRKKKHREQQADPHGAGGASAESILLYGWNEYDRRAITNSVTRRRPYHSSPKQYEHTSVSHTQATHVRANAACRDAHSKG